MPSTIRDASSPTRRRKTNADYTNSMDSALHYAKDRNALNTIARCFPNRDVIGIPAVDLVWGLGTLHCMTQQEPA